MLEKMSTETTKQKMAWRTDREANDTSALKQNPKMQKDESKFKKQGNLVSNFGDKATLRDAMSRGNVEKQQYDLVLKDIPAHVYETEIRQCAKGMQVIGCELEINNMKGLHTGNALLKIRGTASDKELLMHQLQNNIGCNATLKKAKSKPQETGDIKSAVPAAGQNNQLLFKDSKNTAEKSVIMQASNYALFGNGELAKQVKGPKIADPKTIEKFACSGYHSALMAWEESKRNNE